MLRALLLGSVLFLSACDGGIFGTGGGDDGVLLPNASDSNTTADSGSESGDDAGADGGVGGASDAGTGGGTTGADEGGTAPPAVGTDGGDADAGLDAGADGGSDAGTDAGTDGGTDDGREGDAPVFTSSREEFDNQNATLDGPDAKLNMINATSATLNAFDTSVEPDALLFNANGVQPLSASSSVVLDSANKSVSVVNVTDVATELTVLPSLTVANSTLTTLLVRQNGAIFDLIPLSTLTGTSDAGLARVRIVQGSPIGDVSVSALVSIKSAGAAPGGVDKSFGPLSYDEPGSVYIEVPAGDYEVEDEASRFASQAISLSGGVAYTLVLTGENAAVLLINDSQAGE